MAFYIPWWASTLFYSFFVCIYMIINQHTKLKGSVMAAYAGLGSGVVWFLLALFVFGFPTNPMFYLYCFLGGLAIAVLDNQTFNISNKYGSRILSYIRSTNIITTTVLWWIVAPASFISLWNRPWVLVGIGGCLMLAYYAIIKMKNVDEVNKNALIASIPLLIAITVIGVFIKKAVGSADDYIMGLVAWGFVSNMVSGLINMFVNSRSVNPEKIFDIKNLKPGLLITFTMFMFALGVNYSIYEAPNPGYPSAISKGVTIFLVHFYNVWIGRKDKVDLRIGVLFIISTVGLVLLTK